MREILFLLLLALRFCSCGFPKCWRLANDSGALSNASSSWARCMHSTCMGGGACRVMFSHPLSFLAARAMPPLPTFAMLARGATNILEIGTGDGRANLGNS